MFHVTHQNTLCVSLHVAGAINSMKKNPDGVALHQHFCQCNSPVAIFFLSNFLLRKSNSSEQLRHYIHSSWPCLDNFGFFGDFFELFFFQVRLILQHISWVILKNKNWIHEFEFIWDFLSSTQGQKYTYRLKYMHILKNFNEWRQKFYSILVSNKSIY